MAYLKKELCISCHAHRLCIFYYWNNFVSTSRDSWQIPNLLTYRFRCGKLLKIVSWIPQLFFQRLQIQLFFINIFVAAH